MRITLLLPCLICWFWSWHVHSLNERHRQEIAQLRHECAGWIQAKDSVCLSEHNIPAHMSAMLTGVPDSAMILHTARSESGNFSSRVAVECNNVFGLRHDSGYLRFSSWEGSFRWFMEKIYSRKRSGEDYRSFMARVQYGSNLAYLR